MNCKLTRGWRNNNPLNIVHSADKWQGACDNQRDKRFVQFVDMAYGYRAAIKTLQSYCNLFRSKGMTFNIDHIIRRWCPDGSEANYIARVCRLTGFSQYQELPEPKTPQAFRIFVLIMAAMTVQECGVPLRAIPWSSIMGGYWLAYKCKDDEFEPRLKS